MAGKIFIVFSHLLNNNDWNSAARFRIFYGPIAVEIIY